MELLVGLQLVDQVTGARQARQLTAGWIGWQSSTVRHLRALSARLLVALAARSTSRALDAAGDGSTTPEISAP